MDSPGSGSSIKTKCPQQGLSGHFPVSQAFSFEASHFLTLRLTRAQTPSCSDSSSPGPLKRRPTHTQTASHPYPLTFDSLALRFIHTHTFSHSDPLKPRLTHAQTHHAPIRSITDWLTLRLVHTQTHSHSDALALRFTRTHTLSNSGSLLFTSLSDSRLARTHTCRLWECLERKVRPRTHAPIDRYP